MPLSAGTRLGPHEIVAPIEGAGETYRARDTRLDRTVVIQVLPARWADDPVARARFEHDAKMVSALNHPHIRALHDVGRERPVPPGSGGAGDGDAPVSGSGSGSDAAVDAVVGSVDGRHSADARADGVAGAAEFHEGEGAQQSEIDFLVLEDLEGETVADRLLRAADRGGSKKPVAFRVDEATAIAMQIADALDKAHQTGIVHRDLKPSSVFLVKGSKPSDRAVVKILDFGWTGGPARAGPYVPRAGDADVRSARLQPGQGETPPSVTALPTVAAATVQAPAAELQHLEYKAPEQVEGKDADARTDIFSFGALLHEMLTGRKAFEGKSRAVLTAAIMTAEPDPLLALQPQASPALDHVLKRCLAKDPDDRWQTARDLLIQLRWVAGLGVKPATYAKDSGARRAMRIGIAAAVVLAAALAPQAAFYFQETGASEPFQFRSPVVGLNTSDISISPDGRLLAFVARPNTGAPALLFVRPVASVDSRALGGTDDAAQPFWSPDSQDIGFVSGGKLERVRAAGGAPLEIADAQGFTGGTWNRGGTIVFGSAKGLFKVSAEGGKPEPITTIEKGETGHFWPHFLPDGRHYLYLSWSADAAGRALYAGTLDSKTRTRVVASESNAIYTEAGYLVYHRQASVFAQPFDAGARTFTGDAVQVAGGVAFNPANGRGNFDVSQRDALVYLQGDAGGGGTAGRGGTVGQMQFGWVSRTGQPIGPAGAAGPYGDMDLSPDGRLLAVTRQEGAATDVWVIDWQRAAVATRLTLDPSDDLNPVWSHDSTRVAFTTYRKGNADIYVKNADGTGAETALLETPANEMIEAWSRDGRYIAYLSGGADNNQDIYALPLAGDRKPIRVVSGPFQKDEPQFSYDGKWLAYTSNESGSFQVYVTSFPAADQRLQITTAGGGQPRWRQDGLELYYRSPGDNRIMVVDIKPGVRLESGPPRVLFNPVVTATNTREPTRHMLAASPDGQRFLLRVPVVVAGGSSGIAQANTTFAPNTGQSGGRGAIFTGAARGGRAFAAGVAGLTVVRNWTAAMER